jgi:uncharacterized protein YdaU (DUF1376 family)
MNYYNFHIGDYRGATAHLTNDEDLCYRRILDLYYDKDGDITDNLALIARRVRFPEKIVQSILQEFFQKTDAGWVHHRAQKELDSFQNLSKSGKKAAQVRWGSDAIASESHMRFSNSACESHMRIPEIAMPTKNQEPRTNTPLPPAGGKTKNRVEVEEVVGEVEDRGRLGEIADDFQKWWQEYPLQVSQLEASRQWLAVSHHLLPLAEMVQILREHKRSDQWQKEDGKFIPRADNYLAGMKWRDKLPASKSKPASPKPKVIPKVNPSEVEAFMREMYPHKAGTPFDDLPPNVQHKFLRRKTQNQTQEV